MFVLWQSKQMLTCLIESELDMFRVRWSHDDISGIINSVTYVFFDKDLDVEEGIEMIEHELRAEHSRTYVQTFRNQIDAYEFYRSLAHMCRVNHETSDSDAVGRLIILG